MKGVHSNTQFEEYLTAKSSLLVISFRPDFAALPPLNSSAMTVVGLMFRQACVVGVEENGRLRQIFESFAQARRQIGLIEIINVLAKALSGLAVVQARLTRCYCCHMFQNGVPNSDSLSSREIATTLIISYPWSRQRMNGRRKRKSGHS
ncbi:hypothetical protein KCU65_g481, partial [Aureobasidium melanogenum]